MNGVVAIRVAKPANQPYAALAGVLSVSFWQQVNPQKLSLAFSIYASHNFLFGSSFVGTEVHWDQKPVG